VPPQGIPHGPGPAGQPGPPATPITETIRALLLGHASPLPLASALAWCGGIMIVSVALCAILFRRRTAA
jgi:ABC-2 type transport system permease protein